VAREFVLASFGSPLEAELARAFLESREISCSVADAAHKAGSPLEAAFGRPLDCRLRMGQTEEVPEEAVEVATNFGHYIATQYA